MKHDRAVAEIYDAAKLAQKRGAKIIGLGAYTSVVTQGGLSLKGNGLPPLTTGNSFTAVAARQTIRLAASERNWQLARRTSGLLGARGAIVVGCTSPTEGRVRDENLRKNAVVCDISRPSNVAGDVRAQRSDVLMIDGGVVRMPGGSRLGFNASLAKGNAYACMAETMML